jgi:sensor histidine kinase regulating citrate/malate metabolism
VAVFTNVYNTEIDLYTVIQYILVAILLTTLVTFSLIFKIEKESKKEIETRLKLQQIELELKQNKDIINITDNLRKLRHDMNNHIGLIKSLIYDQKYDELREYVDDLYQDVAVANEYIVLENKVLSVLLNSKREKAKELEVDFQSFVAASDINIPEKDICVLFGNILDNAIEAASKAVNSKFVTMSIQKTESGCIIQCENSIGEKPLIKKGKFLTSKSDKNLHGIGTENIIDVVNKYNGKIKFDFDEEVFSIRIVMPT